MGQATVCGICGEPAGATPLVECIECTTVFHLALRTDQQGQECGDAILGQSTGVEMLCNRCIEDQKGPGGGGDVLSMYAALTGGQFVPPGLPAQPALEVPETPARPRPTSKPAGGERTRRRFRRVDR